MSGEMRKRNKQKSLSLFKNGNNTRVFKEKRRRGKSCYAVITAMELH